MAKSITFTKPPNPPISDLTSTLQAGGSLSPAMYYYVVIPVCHPTTSGYLSAPGVYGGRSNEVSGTTDTVNKTIRLDWTAVPSADGYVVYRSTTSDAYTGANRFRRETDNNLYYCTTTNNFFVDSGASVPSLYYNAYPSAWSIIPANDPVPCNLDVGSYGQGCLTLSGGSAVDPIVFQDIYDDAVTNGWTDYIFWDNSSLALLDEAAIAADNSGNLVFLG